jgi:nucleosome assembly protein 1-like 1
MIAEFDKRAAEMKDEDYDKLEITPCDVKSIKNCPTGVSDFWIKAMLNHPVGDMISEKDRPILGYLANIELELHNEGEGFDLIFTFLPNSYFNGT